MLGPEVLPRRLRAVACLFANHHRRAYFGHDCRWLGLQILSQPGAELVNNWALASVAYDLFFVFVCFFVWPYRTVALRIVAAVFISTCFVEFLQLWHPEWLDNIRATLPGRLLPAPHFLGGTSQLTCLDAF